MTDITGAADIKVLAKLTNYWNNGKESGCNVEQLVDDDGYLTFQAHSTYPIEQEYEEVYEERELYKALDWVYRASRRASQSESPFAYLIGSDFTINDEIFEVFPELINDFDADLAKLSDKNGNDIETLRKVNCELEIMTFDFTEFDTKCRSVDEQEARAWIKNGVQKEDGRLKLTAAGAVLFPDIAKELSTYAKPEKKRDDVERG